MTSLALACIEASIAAYLRKHWSAGGAEALAVTLPENIYGIAFRGTADVHDVIFDVRALPVRHPILGLVHRGFASGVDAIWPKIVPTIPDKNMPLAFTGHSKGGAEATLAAALAVSEGRLVKYLITFGSPRVVASSKVEGILARGGVNMLRYVNRGDPVPSVPPWILGFRHIGVKIEIGEAWDIQPDHPAFEYREALKCEPQFSSNFEEIR